MKLASMKHPLRYICPTCGSDAEVGSPCPGCAPGKAKSAGFAQKRSARKPLRKNHHLDGLDLPEDDFDYDDFVAREFGKKPHARLGLKAYWWWLGLALLLLLAAGSLRGFFR